MLLLLLLLFLLPVEAMCSSTGEGLLLPSVFYLLQGDVVGGGLHIIRGILPSSSGVVGRGGGALWGIDSG